MQPLKASILDDDHFRLLAIPFSGPIEGRDMDRQFFSPRTNIHPDLLPARLVDWHHGADKFMGRTVFGKAILDDEYEDDGWWVEVWLDHGQRRLNTIRRLADEAQKRGGEVQIFGSSEALWSKANADGEITDWPYWRQTLSTSPQNTHSIVRPAMKATLDEMTTAGIAVDDHVRSFIADLDALGVDLRSTSLGEDAAKAGRVLASRNEKRLREAIAALTEVMTELDKYTQADQ